MTDDQIINDLALHTINKIQLVLKDTFALIETREQAIKITHFAMTNMLSTTIALSGWNNKSDKEIEKAVIHYLEQAALAYLKGKKTVKVQS